MAREDEDRRDEEEEAALPDCYYGICMRLVTVLLGLGRIALAVWCIYLEIQSIRQENHYAYQKFTLFWCTILVSSWALNTAR